MAADEPSLAAEPVAGDRLSELRASARGWHGVQLAVLGFIGLCGVLKSSTPPGPTWVQVLAGLLVVAALVLACAATYLVGRAAWPLYGARRPRPADDAAEIAHASRQVTRGLLLTFAAVALLAVAALSAWWPAADGADGGAVEARAGSGRWCGTLAEASPGTVRVVTASRTVEIPAASLTALRPVGGC